MEVMLVVMSKSACILIILPLIVTDALLTERMTENCDPVLKAQNRSLPAYDYGDQGHWKGPFHFIQAADTQLGLIDRYLLKSPVPNWDKELELTRAAVKKVNAMRPLPAFFIICGDLVDAYPEQHELRLHQTRDFMDVFKELDPAVPLVCLCGNHDIGDRPTRQSLQSYRDVFGDDYFSFWVGGVLFLVLNSQFYEDASLVETEAAEQERWLEHQLRTDNVGRAKHVVVFQHIPWFLNNVDEDKEYSNLSPALRKTYLDKFQKAGVKAVFAGHYHRNAGGRYGDVDVVVTSAVGAQLGADQSGLRVVKVLDDTISHQYYALPDLPSRVDMN